MKIHLILLAAGNSRRFGGNKLLSFFNGKPMYQYLVDRLDHLQCPFIGEKIVVSQYQQILDTMAEKNYKVIENKHPEYGISYSIQLGVEQLCKDPVGNDDAVCFFVCDQPYLERATVEQFFEAYLLSKKGIGCIGTKSHLGNPVIFKMNYMQELLGLRGDVGGKAVVKKYPEDTFVFETEERQLEDIDYRKKPLVLVRGGGDLASGVIHRIYREGYKLLVLEAKKPACIRRQVAYAEAVYDGETEVEGIKSKLISNITELEECWEQGLIPIMVDEEGSTITKVKPDVVVDAILAKKNLGTTKKMAPLTIALGPGFCAGKDVDYVIETMRGDTLGKIYNEGTAIPNTGIPGVIAGVSKDRVIHSPADGKIQAIHLVGDLVKKGETLAYVGDTPVYATIDGILRGLIRDGFEVKKGLKIMDIDPRISELEQCFLISDKAKKIANSVYETIRRWEVEGSNGFS